MFTRLMSATVTTHVVFASDDCFEVNGPFRILPKAAMQTIVTYIVYVRDIRDSSGLT